MKISSPARALTVALAILLMLPLAAILFDDDGKLSAVHNRALAPAPRTADLWSAPTMFFRSLSNWITDRAGPIETAVKVKNNVLFHVLRTAPLETYTLGRDGHVFLNSGTAGQPNERIEAACVKIQQDSYRATLRETFEVFRAVGARIETPIHLVAVPNTYTLYGDYLPDSVPRRMRNACIARAFGGNSLATVADADAATFLYPFREMMKFRDDPAFYPIANFHPDGLSNKVVIDAYLAKFHGLALDNLSARRTMAVSELLGAVGITRLYPLYKLHYTGKGVVSQDTVAAEALRAAIKPLYNEPMSVVVWQNTGGHLPKTMLLLSDSFGQLAARPFASAFQRVIWVSTSGLPAQHVLDVFAAARRSGKIDDFAFLVAESSLDRVNGWAKAMKLATLDQGIDLNDWKDRSLAGHVPGKTSEPHYNVSITLGGTPRHVLWTNPPVKVLYGGIRASNRTRLSVHLGMHPEVHIFPDASTVFSVRVHDAGKVVDLGEFTLDPQRNAAHRNWLPVEIDLSRFDGRAIGVELSCRPSPLGKQFASWCLWGDATVSEVRRAR